VVRVEPRKGEEFLLDANVLIDFQHADLGALELFAKRVAPLRVLQPTVDEVVGVSARTLKRMGLKVVPMTTEEILAIADRRRKLSLQDALCVQACATGGYTCISNDRVVRSECSARGIACVWGLHVLLFVVRAGGMKRARAHRIAQAMARANPAHLGAEIMERFRKRLFGSA
jgi:predicted nucleic acid-binding protein